MLNSILIAHQDMNAHLAWCLWSIRRSAEATGITDYEVLVIDAGSREPPEAQEPHERMIHYDQAMSVFNKPKLLNVGIDAAEGDVLTFLDADMLVGRNWLSGVLGLRGPAIIRLCYRVRRLSAYRWLQLQHSTDRDKFTRWLFRRYDHFNLAFEAYGKHDHNAQPTTADERRRVFGNSQFSVTREKLAHLRPNEGMAGHGTEDLEFNQQFERHYGDHYRGVLESYPPNCLFHLPHEHTGWKQETLPQCCRMAVVDRDGNRSREDVRYIPSSALTGVSPK